MTGRLQPADPITPLVTYPAIVDLARVLAMPRWRHPADSDDDVCWFRQDINRYVGIQHDPQDISSDPLSRWFQTRHDPHAANRM